MASRILITGVSVGLAIVGATITQAVGADFEVGASETDSNIVREGPASPAVGPVQTDVRSGRTDVASVTFRRALAVGQDDPLLLPTTLPPGGIPDETNFLATDSPITDESTDGRVWLTHFSPGSLPPAEGNVGGYVVYQHPVDAKQIERCGEQRKVDRTVGRHSVTVCLGPHPTQTAIDYWSHVTFSAELGDIRWIDMNEELN